MNTGKKIVLIGMDGLMPEQVDRYRSAIPELQRFLDEGFFSPAHSSPYTCTATNWPTIATGAWVGTHGCTSFNVHLPGMELGETTPSFNSMLCQAEYFWHAAERQGKRSILINYPCAFPKLLENGVVIGGDGLSSPTWRVRGPDLWQSHPESMLGRLMPPNRVVLRDAGAWANVPTDCTIVREGEVGLGEQGRFTWNAAGIQADDAGTDTSDATGGERRYLLIVRKGAALWVILSPSRDVNDAIVTMSPGQWSGWVEERFGGRDCLRQYKLIELGEEGSRVGLYGTSAYARAGWGYPAGIEDQIIAHAGGYVEALELEGCSLLRSGKFDDMMLEIMRLQADWMVDCANHLNRTEDWDNMWLQFHAPDGVSHAFLRYLEEDDAVARDRADRMLRETVRILFQMADRVVRACADEDTVVCIVSDHGNLPKTHIVMPDVMLHKNSWLTIKGFDARGFPIADTKASKAMAGGHGVWLNVRGREKHGCVEPGPEYEQLRSEIINELKSMRDPETGEALFSLVGRREEFAGMGLWGERVEDIVMFATTYNFHMSDMNLFHTHKDFYDSGREVVHLDECIERGLIWDLTAVHWGLPEATAGYASNRPVLFLRGPGVKKGARGDRRVNLVDVAPTLAHVLGVVPPAQCEGRIVREALEQEGSGDHVGE